MYRPLLPHREEIHYPAGLPDCFDPALRQTVLCIPLHNSYLTEEKHFLNNNSLREFGLKTIRYLCPCVRCSLAAVLVSGPPSVHVAQTLRFSRFVACPRGPFAFKAIWVQNHALAVVWRTCVLLTSFFIDWIGLGALESKSLHYYKRAPFGNDYKNLLKVRIVHSDLHF